MVASGDGRISVMSIAVHRNSSITYFYESDVVFDPLGNSGSAGDDGEYTCYVEVEDAEFINGSMANGTQTISVEGQLTYRWTEVSFSPLVSRPWDSLSEGGV